MTTSQTGGMNRTLTGVLAVGCAMAGIALCAVRGTSDTFGAGLIRAGLVLGALWCALPTRARQAAWAGVSPYAVGGVAIALAVFVRHLRVLLPLTVGLAFVAYLLRPRKPRAPRSSR
ncbi:MAG: hypothetical protein U0992_05125 [Planctomycetaceae bacterium]